MKGTSFKHMVKALLTLLLLNCLSGCLALSYASTKIVSAETVLPLVEISNGQVVTCGLVASAIVGAERFEVRSGIKRNPPATNFFFDINRYNADGSLISPDGIESWLPFSEQSDAETKSTSSTEIPAYSDKAAADMQSIMLRGFRAIMIRSQKDDKLSADNNFEHDRQRIEIEVKGPLPQNVRATYLNCSGDMYRQE